MAQFGALLIKQAHLQKRRWKTNCCQIVFPVLFFLGLVGLQALVDSNIGRDIDKYKDPFSYPPYFVLHEADDNDDLQDAFKSPADFLYTIDNSVSKNDNKKVQDIMDQTPKKEPVRFVRFKFPGWDTDDLLSENVKNVSASTSEATTNSVMQRELYKKWYKKSRYMGAYDYKEMDYDKERFRYTVFFNETLGSGNELPFLIGQITRRLSQQVSNIVVGLTSLRLFPTKDDFVTFDIKSAVGPLVYLIILHQLFPVFLTIIVYEKEKGLRQLQRMMGMHMSSYWMTMYFVFYLIYLAFIILMIIAGAILDFRFFTINNPGVYLVLFLIWGNVLIALVFLASVFFNRTQTAAIVGYFFLLFVVFVSSVLVAEFVNNPEGALWPLVLLNIFPSFALFNALAVLGREVNYNGDGVGFDDISDPIIGITRVYGFLLVLFIIILLAFMYLEQVWPSKDQLGKKRPSFILQRSFWGMCGLRTDEENEKSVMRDLLEYEGEDDDGEGSAGRADVDLEKERVRGLVGENQTSIGMDGGGRSENTDRSVSGGGGGGGSGGSVKGETVVRIVELSKRFTAKSSSATSKRDMLRSCCCCCCGDNGEGDGSVFAVKGLTFGIQENECFGILGHNGAGKTTLLSMLTGLIAPSAGTAYMFNKCVRDTGEMDELHKIMGVCPQHDVLWGSLTAAEHLMYYGRLKGLRRKKLDAEVKKALKRVGLYDAKDRLSKTFSGGMKRRLSVAISLLGSPKLVIMDEPTTGLDPVSRYHLWDVIAQARKECTIIFTSHSMEEAEALCDRITIMSQGRLRCIGSAAGLKQKFGQGYRLTVQCDHGHADDVHQFVLSRFSDVELIDELGDVRGYKIGGGGGGGSGGGGGDGGDDDGDEVKLSEIFSTMEEDKEGNHVLDWAVRHATLEEVFLKVTDFQGHGGE
eukprot:TRINITY_DN1027_c0_g1_i1.p1 TRINITY_DN1027_c0_g1~~TRINITY_DN1027_c0_g1_i1.p1  ORF type:complete len:919 (+),score=265.13 TRINITY_DN1027_c0_g1_i1:431-3187(+)